MPQHSKIPWIGSRPEMNTRDHRGNEIHKTNNCSEMEHNSTDPKKTEEADEDSERKRKKGHTENSVAT